VRGLGWGVGNFIRKRGAGEVLGIWRGFQQKEFGAISSEIRGIL